MQNIYNQRVPTSVACATGSDDPSALPRAGTVGGAGTGWLLLATLDPFPGFGTPARKTFMALLAVHLQTGH